MQYGTLYLIPVTLGEDNIAHVVPPAVAAIAQNLDSFIVESEKSARHFLGSIKTKRPIRELEMYLLNEHTEDKVLPTLLKPLITGRDVGLMSDAGCPGIADPGAKLIDLAHQKQIRVVPLVGPSSILLSLMASGLNGQQFAFLGYLPVDKEARILKLRTLEKRALAANETQIFIETPYRNHTMLEAILQHCQPNTRLCVAADVTLSTESIVTKTIAQWKKQPIPDLRKRPTVFLLLA